MPGINSSIFKRSAPVRRRNPPGLAGTHNHALVELHGVSTFVELMALDSEPADPEGTNTVTVMGRR